MSKEDAKTVIGKLIGSMNGGGTESGKPLAGEKGVKEALNNVVNGSGKVSVSSDTGDGSQKVEAKFTGKSGGAKSTDVQIDGVPAVDQVKADLGRVQPTLRRYDRYVPAVVGHPGRYDCRDCSMANDQP